MMVMTQIYGHRGASAVARENTLEAFERAIDMGADGIEFDLRRTRDGCLVVHHDPVVSGGSAIVECRADELASSIPTFDAALDICATVAVNVEIKNLPGEPDFDPSMWIVDRLLAALAARPDGNRVLVSSFHGPTVARVRQRNARVRTALLIASGDSVETATEAGHDAIHPAYADLDETLVRDAHRAGVAVNVWTVNEPTDIDRCLALGVDGIVTDYPDRALERRRDIRA